MKCWLQTDADLYISTRDVWLEDCRIVYNNNSLMRNAYANFYAENVLFNTGGSTAINGISAYDTESFYITQGTFDGFATPVKLENISVCPEDVNVEIRQTTIKNYAQNGIQAEDVHRMYLYANSIEGNANATTGLWLEDVIECRVEAGNIKNHTYQPGVFLYNTRYFILDGATIKNNYRGIESYRSNIYLRNQATIKQNTAEGIFAFSAISYSDDPDILCKIVIGDIGCGWIIQNETGILGEDILLDIDAITHAINEGDTAQPNRFDGNTRAIEVCYEYFNNTYISDTLMARGNYWTGGGAPIGSDVSTGFDIKCSDITTDASLYVTTQPTSCDCVGNCIDIEDEEALTLRMANYSCNYYINNQGGGRITIAEKYQEAYQLFLENDFNYAYQKFNWIKNRVEAEYPQGLPDGICKDLYGKAYWYKDQMAVIAEVYCQYPFYERMIEDNNIIPRFSVFPNPAQNIVVIACTEIGKTNYTIFSASGNQMQSGSFEGSTQLQLENYASGIYFINLQTETAVETLKLMVE
ncbi:MAG: T9SS type A sorting domain-containing protein [Chitinophagales bacterium]